MKILLVTHYYPEHKSGIEIVAGNIANYIVKNQGFEIHWISSDVTKHPKTPNLFCYPAKTLNFFETKLTLPYPIWDFKSLLKIWHLTDTIDIVHIHDYLYMGNLFAFLSAKIKKKPIIITQHIGFIPYKNPIARLILSFLNNTIGRIILRNSDQVIFISENVQRYFSKITPFKRPPVLISNGFEDQYLNSLDSLEERKKIREKLNLPKDKFIFLFVGRFIEKKGLDLLKEIVKEFREDLWIFIGWGPLSPRKWRLDNVLVFENLTMVDIIPFYQVANLLVLPSKGEGFPLVVQESMACGTPCIVSTETYNSYTPAKSLLFHASLEGNDIAKRWVDALNNIKAKYKVTDEIRHKVATFAKEHWNMETCINKYIQITKYLREVNVKY